MSTRALPIGSSLLNKKIGSAELSILATYVFVVLAGLAWTRSMGSVAFLCTLCVLAIALISSSEICCRLLFVCFPFFNIMGSDLGGTSMFYVLILLFAAKSLIDGSVQSAGRRLTLYGLIILATLYNYGAGLTYMKWLIHLLVPVLLIGTGRMRRNFPVYLKFLTISLILSSAVGQMMLDAGVYLYTFGSVRVDAEITTRFSGLVGDAVVYGQLVSVVIGANAYLAFSGKGYRLAAPLCLVLVFFAFMTYSKGALVSLAIVGMFVLVAYVKRAVEGQVPVRYIVYALAAVAVVYFGAGILSSGATSFSPDALMKRLDSDDLLTARAQIWSAYFDLWGQVGAPMVFKGIGFDVYQGTTVYGRWHNCHNIYIEAVTLFGVLGATAMAAALLGFLVKRVRSGAAAMSILPCVILLASGMILHGFLDFPFFYVWTVALGCVDYSFCLAREAGRSSNSNISVGSEPKEE